MLIMLIMLIFLVAFMFRLAPTLKMNEVKPI